MVFGRQKSTILHRGFFGHRSSSDVSDATVAASQRGTRPVSRVFSAAPAIAEDGCEVVPQFFPGYHVNNPSTVQRSRTTLASSTHYPGRHNSQRRVGCIKLATPSSDTATTSTAADQTLVDPRRFSGASFTSTSTTSTLNALPQQPHMNGPVCVSSPAHSHPTTVSPAAVAESDTPGTYSYRRRGSSLSIHKAPTISGSAATSPVPHQQQYCQPHLQQSAISQPAISQPAAQYYRRSATGLQALPRNNSSEYRLQRNNTTKTVSRNDLVPEPVAAVAASVVAPNSSYSGYRRLNSSRSANFHGTTRRNGIYRSTTSPSLTATYGPSACYGALPKHSPTTRSPLAHEQHHEDYYYYEDGVYICGGRPRDEGIDVTTADVMAHTGKTGLTGSCLRTSCQDCVQSPADISPLILSSPPCVPPKALYSAANPQTRVPVLPTPPSDGCNYVLTPVSDDSALLCGPVGYAEDEEDIANKLVPRIDSCGPQLAYLPPRSSNLAVIN